MRTFLGVFLAIHGAVWWFGWLLIAFFAGMLAGSSGLVHEWPIPWKVAALPALTLLLAMGDAMVVLGITLIGANRPHLIGRQHPVVPESHAVAWFLLRSLRYSGGVLALTFLSGFFSLTFLELADLPRTPPPAVWISTATFTLLGFGCAWGAHHLLARFRDADDPPTP